MRTRKRFYRHCPDCGQRMKRTGQVGSEEPSCYNLCLDYECPCGACWTCDVNSNALHRGRSKDYRPGRPERGEL